MHRDTKLPIAIVTHNAADAIQALQVDHRIQTYNSEKRRGVLKDGRAFIMASQPRDLQGARIQDYEIVGLPDSQLITLADTRKIHSLSPQDPEAEAPAEVVTMAPSEHPVIPEETPAEE